MQRWFGNDSDQRQLELDAAKIPKLGNTPLSSNLVAASTRPSTLDLYASSRSSPVRR